MARLTFSYCTHNSSVTGITYDNIAEPVDSHELVKHLVRFCTAIGFKEDDIMEAMNDYLYEKGFILGEENK